MTSDTPSVQLIGFESDAGLGDLLAQFRVTPDYKSMLPGHLLDILRKQFPDVVIESIELLKSPGCSLGGMQLEDNKTFVRVQTLNVPLDLRIVLKIATGRFALDIQLVFRCEGLDSTPAMVSDMFVKAERRMHD